MIDPDFRGNIKVVLFNFSDCDFYVQKGTRTAQFICEKFVHCDVLVCECLRQTDRGCKGCGSTGLK